MITMDPEGESKDICEVKILALEKSKKRLIGISIIFLSTLKKSFCTYLDTGHQTLDFLFFDSTSTLAQPHWVLVSLT